MAQGNAIASGSVIISANADRLDSGLKAADKKVQHWSKGLGSNIGNELATELGKRGFAGGVLGGLIGGGIGGGLSEIIANTLGELGVTDWINKGVKGVFAFATGSERVREAFERVTAELKASGAEMDKNLEKAERWRIALDREGQLADIQSQLTGLSKEWDALNDRSLEAERRLAELNGPKFGGLPSFGQRGKLQAEINAVTSAQNDITDKMLKLMSQREQMEINLAAAAQKMVEAKKEEIAVWGIAGSAAEETLMRMRGHTEDQIKAVRDLNTELKRLASTNLGKTGVPFGFLLGAAGTAANMMQGGSGFPGLGIAMDVLGRVANTLPTHDVFGAAFGPKQASKASLAEAVETGTAQGYSLSVRNRFGGIEGGTDANKANGVKLDAIRMTIKEGFDAIKDAMRGVGIL